VNEKLSSKILDAILVIETVLGLAVIAGIILSSVDILKYFKIIFETPPIETFSVMQLFLGHILTLVIGLELVVMLVRHTPSSVIEVLLYAIARKMIIDSKTMMDIVLGIIAIAGLFAINKFFQPGQFLSRQSNLVNPAMLIRDVNELAGVNIPEGLGNTIGGALSLMCQKRGEEPVVGKMFKIADAEIVIHSMEGELIRKIMVTKL
jgi:hypothetical protein